MSRHSTTTSDSGTLSGSGAALVVALLAASCGGDDGGDEPRCPDCRFDETPLCHRPVCSAETATCGSEKVEDGTVCDSTSFCSYGDRCQDGRCIAGTEIECPEVACQRVTCDPVSDQCVYEPVNDDEPCSIPCVAEGVCVDGQCLGEETDCSWLDDHCNAGACHPELGDCYLEPLPRGADCVPTDPSCAIGACNGLGDCDDQPFADGTECDDGNRCTDKDGCLSGICQGRVITACVSGDGCCPDGCVNDDDCCTALGPGTDPDAWRFAGTAEYDTDAGHVALTPARNWNWGHIWLQHQVTRTFVAQFRFRAAMSGDSADGIVFMFYKDADYTPRAGGELSFDAGDGCDEETVGTGYGVEIDHWNNPCDSSANHVGLIHQRIGNHLAVVDDPRTFDGQWHDMVVTVDVDTVTVQLDGDTILTWTGAIDRTHGGLGFGAATGGANDEYVVDDIQISCL